VGLKEERDLEDDAAQTPREDSSIRILFRRRKEGETGEKGGKRGFTDFLKSLTSIHRRGEETLITKGSKSRSGAQRSEPGMAKVGDKGTTKGPFFLGTAGALPGMRGEENR